MSIVPAQMSVTSLRASAGAPAYRWPRAVGLGLAGLVSAGLWGGLILVVQHII